MTMGLSNSKPEPELDDGMSSAKASALGSRGAKGSSDGCKNRTGSSSLAISAESLFLEASLMHGQSFADLEDEYRSKGTVSTEGSPDLSLDGTDERAPGNRKANATHHTLLGWLRRTAKSPPADPSSKPPYHVHVIPSTTCMDTSAAATMTAPSPNTTRKSLSTNTTPTRSSKLPIPRKRNSVSNDCNSRTSYDDDDVEHLKRLYQARTWEMYFRITEARKRASLNDLNNATHTGTGTGTFATSSHYHPEQFQQHPNPHAFFMPRAVAVNNDNINNNPSGYDFNNNAGGLAPTSFHHHQANDDSEHELFLGDLEC